MNLKNYHTHTFRCQHATGSDWEYVEQAIKQGFTVLGFSDHTPWPYDPHVFISQIRMRVEQLPEYVASIRSLSNTYAKEITLKVGLECEAFPEFFPWLEKTAKTYGLDYLILGNHFHHDEINKVYYGHTKDPNMVLAYVRSCEEAMDTGLFAYVAHPDFIFQDYPVFDSFCEDASHRLCSHAEKLGIPLEYNVSGILKRAKGESTGLGFPCKAFWEIAKHYHVKVIIGLDAHAPERIDGNLFVQTQENLLAEGLNLVDTF